MTVEKRIEEFSKYFESKNIRFKFVKRGVDNFHFYIFLDDNYIIQAQGTSDVDHLYACEMYIDSGAISYASSKFIYIPNAYNASLTCLTQYVLDFKKYHKKSIERVFEILHRETDNEDNN